LQNTQEHHIYGTDFRALKYKSIYLGTIYGIKIFFKKTLQWQISTQKFCGLTMAKGRDWWWIRALCYRTIRESYNWPNQIMKLFSLKSSCWKKKLTVGHT
jgi:hypothetical protein